MNVAVMKTKAEQTLSEAFETAASKLPGGEAVLNARRAAMARFTATGLPHRRVEEWKYTDLRVNLKEALPLSLEDSAKVTVGDLIVALGPLAHLDVHRITFVNGRCRPELSDLAGSTIEVKPLGGSLIAAPDKVGAGLASTTGPVNRKWVAPWQRVCPATLLHVSPASCWELAMLVEKGRLRLDRDVGTWIRDALSKPTIRVVELTPEIAVTAARLPRFHGDPADRMIAATALTIDCGVVTKDRKLRAYQPLRTIW